MKKVSFILFGLLCVLMATPQINASVPVTGDQLPAMIDMSCWQYNETDDVYWQVGIPYCATPLDESYENLGIFIPGAYMSAQDNGDGTYTCTVSSENTCAGYTANTAPVLFPVNTPGHKAQDPPAGYDRNASKYTDNGFIYVCAGCRGKNAGAPAGVTDLKAAIRFIRMNKDSIPGCMERVVAFGMSGGGSQTAVLGASGDSDLYQPYLNAIGAVDESDAINAAMCWCPITSFDSADEGHEWSMGNTRTGLSDEYKRISDSLAEAYSEYVNNMGFTDEAGNILTLEESEEGICQAGSYYEYVKQVIEESLEHYLSDHEFPLSTGGGQGQSSGGPGGGNAKGGPGENADNKTETIYQTPADYIAGLNEDTEWVIYDENRKTVTITSIHDFTSHRKIATKPVAAFDKLEEGGHDLYNTGDGEMTHFDRMLEEIIQGTEYEDDFADDLSRLDALGYTVDYRLHTYSPLYYLMPVNEGYKTASVAPYWRIRTGIEQSDTPLTTEVNLALALQMYGADVDFETVWGQGHTQAERSGNSEQNFIEWVHSLWD